MYDASARRTSVERSSTPLFARKSSVAWRSWSGKRMATTDIAGGFLFDLRLAGSGMMSDDSFVGGVSNLATR